MGSRRNPRYTTDPTYGQNGFMDGPPIGASMPRDRLVRPSPSRHHGSPQMFYGYMHDGYRRDPHEEFNGDILHEERGRYLKSSSRDIHYHRYRRMMCCAVSIIVLLILLILIIGAVLLAIYIPRGTSSTTSSDFCENNNCVNGGTCRNNRCECPLGFGGDTCDTTNTVTVDAVLRLIGETFTNDLLDSSSAAYQQLESNAETALNNGLIGADNFVGADVTSFRNGSVLVYIVVHFDVGITKIAAENQLRNVLPNVLANEFFFTSRNADTTFIGISNSASGTVCADDPCENGGTCFNIGGDSNAYTCLCTSLYTGDNCQDEINQCTGSTCLNGGTCTQLVGAFRCTCEDGFAGVNCETNVDECESVTCENGGTCEDLINNYRCLCPVGVGGTTCEIDIDECASNPCLHSGTCSTDPNVKNSFTCDCSTGYAGDTCNVDINDCSTNPCQNGATCEDGVNEATCTCASGWEGQLCDGNIDDCANNPCLNDGTCVDGVDSYNCTCPPGLTGDRCQDNINECESNPCQNGGICTDGLNNFTCNLCNAGYTGRTCETDIDECASDPCENAATCVDGVNGYTCSCGDGFSGELCETDIDECACDPCENSGNCTDSVNGYTCACVTGFQGINCETNIDDCANDPCQNGGTCTDSINSYNCTCPIDFEGSNCENEIDQCSTNPCANGAICHDGVDEFSCVCAQGYNGPTCINIVQNINMTLNVEGEFTDALNNHSSSAFQNLSQSIVGAMADTLNGTDSNFTYIDTMVRQFSNGSIQAWLEIVLARLPQNSGQYIVEYIQVLIEDAISNNDSSLSVLRVFDVIIDQVIDNCYPNHCMNGSTCVDGLNTYTCICADGFSGRNCTEDIDECFSTPCLQGGTCVDEINGYTCRCIPGLEGARCEKDTNECSANPCFNNGTCAETTLGKFNCTCPDGFNGDTCDETVLEVNLTLVINRIFTEELTNPSSAAFQELADNVTSAVNDLLNETLSYANLSLIVEGSVVDEFRNGSIEAFVRIFLRIFTSLISRQQVRDIVDKQISDDIRMIDSLLSRRLGPIRGVTVAGADLCESRNPCENGGICAVQGSDEDTITCSCLPGFSSSKCEINLDECVPDPCMNGTCLDGINEYTCDCYDGFQGVNCSEEINECAYNPCQNGTCRDALANFTCDCDVGFSGRICDVNIDDCDPNPCVNGNCTDGVDKYDCDCDDGFNGTNCTVDIYECISSPCLQDGTCVDGINGYTCECIPGLEGPRCENDTDECAAEPCFNNGTCEETTLGEFNCSCQKGYSGETCDETVMNVNGELLLDQQFTEDLANSSSPGFQDLAENVTSGLNAVFNGSMNSSMIFEGAVVNEFRNGSVRAIFILIYTIFTSRTTSQGVRNAIDRQIIVDIRSNNSKIAEQVGPVLDALVMGADICSSRNPCKNDGLCAINGTDESTITCQCLPGFTGDLCGTNIDDCEQSPCANSGTCVDGINNYTCICVDGYTGSDCEADIDECVDDPCKNGATCRNEVANYTCECTDGYWGRNCDINIDDCESEPCLNGDCVDGINSYLCDCDDGFNGTNCTENIDDCLDDPCDNGAICYDGIANFTCECQNGYSGHVCDVDIDECEESPCFNNGTCSEAGVGEFICECLDQFNGTLCNEAPQTLLVDIVLDRPFTADLKDADSEGFQNLSSRIVVVVNEHFSFLNGNSENASATFVGANVINFSNGSTIAHVLMGFLRLTNKGSSSDLANFIDSLLPELIGVHSTLALALDIAVVAAEVPTADICISRNPCRNDAQCQIDGRDISTLSCDCRPGFRGSFCETDINDCHGIFCSFRGECRDLVNDFNCQCEPGAGGELCQSDEICTDFHAVLEPGVTLQDVYSNAQGATSIPDKNSSSPEFEVFFKYYNASRNITLQSIILLDFLDSVPRWDNVSERSDNRTEISGEACLQIPPDAADGSQAIWESVAYLLDHYRYFILSSVNISAIYVEGDNKCYPNPCQSAGDCRNVDERDYFCTCEPGYEGRACELEINECELNPCQNGGNCTDRLGDYQCNCVAGWIGRDCSIDENDCAISPCSNGATCIDELGRFRCQCAPGYKGEMCRTAVDACQRAVCQNGGICQNFLSYYTCACPEGFYGTNCTESAPICADDFCANGATCYQRDSCTFFCACTEGWTGIYCEENIDDCRNVNCSGYGNCVDLDNGYNCQCPKGFTGKDCEEETDECIAVDCLNGGYCVDGQFSFRCTCLPGWTGQFCERGLDECDSNPCENGGECTDGIDYFTCRCLPGWQGETCDTPYLPCDERNPCENNGTCLPGVLGSFTCDCPAEFRGSSCEIRSYGIPVRLLVNHTFNSSIANSTTDAFRELQEEIIALIIMDALNSTAMREKFGVVSLKEIRDGGNDTTLIVITVTYWSADVDYRPYADITQSLLPLIFDRDSGLASLNLLDLSVGDIDECQLDRCRNNAQCVDLLDSYDCDCPPGVYGRDCEYVDYCFHQYCSFNGECENADDDDYECDCYEPYAGRNCESRVGCTTIHFALDSTGDVDNFFNETLPPSPPIPEPNEFTDILDFLESNDSIPIVHRLVQYLAKVLGSNDDEEDTDEVDRIINRTACLPINDDDYGFPVDALESLAYLLEYYSSYFESLGVKIWVDGDDPCIPSPCLNNGRCWFYIDGFECLCPPGFEGEICDRDINECKDDPCANGGNCTDGRNTFNCSCAAGWTGQRCTVDFNECYSAPCANGGRCIDEFDGYTCICIPGYNGSNCRDMNDACAENPCNGGNCSNYGSYFACDCGDSFGGTCTGESNDYCVNNTDCLNYGTCEKNATPCNCTEGWSGVFCEANIDDCVNVTCNERGDCIDLLNDYTCSCSAGFLGKDCEQNIDDCEGVVCHNGGQCLDEVNLFFCRCEGGWTGKFCLEEIDECEDNPCANGGQCEDFFGGYVCNCEFGWRGQNCSEIINPCYESKLCLNDGECISDGPGLYNCTCTNGFQGDNCEIGVINVTAQLLSACTFTKNLTDPSSATYRQFVEQLDDALYEAFELLAEYGLLMKYCGFETRDIKNWNGNILVVGSFCYRSSEENYSPITDITWVLYNSAFDPNSTLSALKPLNFTLEEIDECAGSPCQNEGVCEDYRDWYTCDCPLGFIGRNCEIDVCEYFPCANNGTCVPLNASYTDVKCECPPGKGGVFCEFDIFQVPITVTVSGYCNVTVPDVYYWIYYELSIGEGTVYGQVEEVDLVDWTPFNISLNIILNIYSFVVEEIEDADRDAAVDITAALLVALRSVEVPENIMCTAEFVSPRGIEVCDHFIPYWGYLPDDRCSGLVECPYVYSDEIGCDPQIEIILGEDDCRNITSPNYPAPSGKNEFLLVTVEAPPGYFIELLIDPEQIDLEFGDSLSFADGHVIDIFRFFPVNELSIPYFAPRFNTLTRRMLVLFVRNGDGEYAAGRFFLQVKARMVNKRHYDIPIFESQVVNVPMGAGSYPENVIVAITLNTTQNGIFVLCTDLIITNIDTGDKAVLGVTNAVAVRHVVALYNEEAMNPTVLETNEFFMLLESNDERTDPNEDYRYTGEVFSIPRGYDPSDVCSERFNSSCLTNPCNEGWNCSIDIIYHCTCPTPPLPREICEENFQKKIILQEGPLVISSFNYPAPYPRNTYQFVTIVAPPEHFVEMVIPEGSIQLHPGDIIVAGRGRRINSSEIFLTIVNSSVAGTPVRVNSFSTEVFFLFTSSPEGRNDLSTWYGFSILAVAKPFISRHINVTTSQLDVRIPEGGGSYSKNTTTVLTFETALNSVINMTISNDTNIESSDNLLIGSSTDIRRSNVQRLFQTDTKYEFTSDGSTMFIILDTDEKSGSPGEVYQFSGTVQAYTTV